MELTTDSGESERQGVPLVKALPEYFVSTFLLNIKEINKLYKKKYFKEVLPLKENHCYILVNIYIDFSPIYMHSCTIFKNWYHTIYAVSIENLPSIPAKT